MAPRGTGGHSHAGDAFSPAELRRWLCVPKRRRGARSTRLGTGEKRSGEVERSTTSFGSKTRGFEDLEGRQPRPTGAGLVLSGVGLKDH